MKSPRIRRKRSLCSEFAGNLNTTHCATPGAPCTFSFQIAGGLRCNNRALPPPLLLAPDAAPAADPHVAGARTGHPARTVVAVREPPLQLLRLPDALDNRNRQAAVEFEGCQRNRWSPRSPRKEGKVGVASEMLPVGKGGVWRPRTLCWMRLGGSRLRRYRCWIRVLRFARLVVRGGRGRDTLRKRERESGAGRAAPCTACSVDHCSASR